MEAAGDLRNVRNPAREQRARAGLDPRVVAKLEHLGLRARRLRATADGLWGTLRGMRERLDRLRAEVARLERDGRELPPARTVPEDGGRRVASYERLGPSPALLVERDDLARQVAALDAEYQATAKRAAEARQVATACYKHAGLAYVE